MAPIATAKLAESWPELVYPYELAPNVLGVHDPKSRDETPHDACAALNIDVTANLTSATVATLVFSSVSMMMVMLWWTRFWPTPDYRRPAR